MCKSSEDDGLGGRRKKKGVKDKIKEKLPGPAGVGTTTSNFSSTTAMGQGVFDRPTSTAGTGSAAHQSERQHEKKGLMEKIKEKLPGHHSNTHH